MMRAQATHRTRNVLANDAEPAFRGNEMCRAGEQDPLRTCSPGKRCLGRAPGGYRRSMALLLWIIAAVLVIAGIITLISGSVIWGIVLIVVGCLVGPGGYSIFHTRT